MCGQDAAPTGGGDAAISQNPQMAHAWHTRRGRTCKYMQRNALEFYVLPVLRVRAERIDELVRAPARLKS
jgi:hypothetical protein